MCGHVVGTLDLSIRLNFDDNTYRTDQIPLTTKQNGTALNLL